MNIRDPTTKTGICSRCQGTGVAWKGCSWCKSTGRFRGEVCPKCGGSHWTMELYPKCRGSGKKEHEDA